MLPPPKTQTWPTCADTARGPACPALASSAMNRPAVGVDNNLADLHSWNQAKQSPWYQTIAQKIQPEFHSFVFHFYELFLVHLHKQNLDVSFTLDFFGSFWALWNFRQHDSGFQTTKLLARWHLGDLTVNHLGCLTPLKTTKVACTLNLKGSLCKITRVGMKLVCPGEDTILCYQTTKREVCTISVV